MNATTPFPWPAESAGTSAERELRLVFAHFPRGVAQCTEEGTITAANPAMEQMFGNCTAPISHLRDLVGSSGRGESEQLFREMLAGQRNSFQVVTPKPGSEKGDTPVKWTTWRVEAVEKEPAYGLIMAEDAAAGHRSERSLRQAQKFEALGRIAGGIAHDFNNLVTGVLLYSDLLLAEMDSGTRLRGYVEEIRAAGIQAADVVRQLRVAARPQEAPPPILLLNSVVEGMRDLLVRLVGAAGIVQFNLDRNLGLIRMLPSQAQQILLNLVLNARDAIADGGRIIIETTNCRVQLVTEGSGNPEEDARPGERPSPALPCAVLSVSDNGMGMDAETQEHLFEAFFTTKTPDKGTGLGLATVHDLVSNSGGLIYVDSAPGRGTRVTILLPVVPEQMTSSYTPTFETVGHEGAPLQPAKEK